MKVFGHEINLREIIPFRKNKTEEKEEKTQKVAKRSLKPKAGAEGRSLAGRVKRMPGKIKDLFKRIFRFFFPKKEAPSPAQENPPPPATENTPLPAQENVPPKATEHEPPPAQENVPPKATEGAPPDAPDSAKPPEEAASSRPNIDSLNEKRIEGKIKALLDDPMSKMTPEVEQGDIKVTEQFLLDFPRSRYKIGDQKFGLEEGSLEDFLEALNKLNLDQETQTKILRFCSQAIQADALVEAYSFLEGSDLNPSITDNGGFTCFEIGKDQSGEATLDIHSCFALSDTGTVEKLSDMLYVRQVLNFKGDYDHGDMTLRTRYFTESDAQIAEMIYG